jgi:LDH2 family malate/lactate/ureidoglycolate dehydrogenase
MAPAYAAETAALMVAADLRGIESHGVGMLELYAEYRAKGRLATAPTVRVVREGPATALIDGGGGLGHVPSARAMRLAIEKSRAAGVGAVAVRNSNHFGAAGVYALMAAEAGLIGVATSGVWNVAIVPTFGVDPMFGTNPIAFAAPAGRNPPFVLDMATSTAAIGKVKLAKMRGERIPEGWAVDADGAPVTDPDVALAQRRLTPLGGERVMGGHKGYGLAAMVEILSTVLSGAAYAPLRARRYPDAERYNVGHFLMALDPGAFRGEGDFRADLDDMIDALRSSRPRDPAEPVLVAGDPERACEEERRRHGIPLPAPRVALLRRLAAEAGCEFVLQPRG